MKSMFRFVNRETTIGCKRVIFNGFFYVTDILKTAGQAKKTIGFYGNILYIYIYDCSSIFSHFFFDCKKQIKATLLLFNLEIISYFLKRFVEQP